MSTWVLILTVSIMSPTGTSIAVTSVPGFTNSATCESAARAWELSVKVTAKTGGTFPYSVCVNQAGIAGSP